MMRAIGILALDVFIFVALFIIGAAVQGALPWPSFVGPFLLLPAFLYGSYRNPDRSRDEMRGLLCMTIAVSVAMGVVFDFLRFPVGSATATLLIIGIIPLAYAYCLSRCANESSQRSS